MSRLAPVLALSLLLHLALLYGAGRWTLSRVKVEPAAGTEVAYLDLGLTKYATGDGPAPDRAAAPVAAFSAPVSPAAAPGISAPAVRPDEVQIAAPPALPTAVPPHATAATTRDAFNREAGNHPARAAGGEAEAVGLDTAGGRTTASAQGITTGATPAAALPRGRAGTTGGGSRELRGSYQAKLKLIIEAHKEYPLAARKSGREGSCRRRFMLRRDGSLQQVESASSCGHPFLDAAASRAISSVGIFPPPPVELPLDEPFEVIITFTMSTR